jgi:4-hydroxyphenylpyruvate dioxygenase
MKNAMSIAKRNPTSGRRSFEGAADFLPLLGTDYIELYVGNAKQAAHYYKTAFGFQSLAYAGLETGVKDRTSYVLEQDKIRLVLTTPLTQGQSDQRPPAQAWRWREGDRAVGG